jgi:putative redox protein
MVDINIKYEGDMHCTAKHEPSASTLATDAPVDNHGRGETFSPTDLVATGLGTCMSTVMGILARKNGWLIEGTTVHVKKHMTAAPPRRIARLATRIEFPSTTAALDAQARRDLEHTANTCPVRLSLLDAIEVPVEFVWPKP